MNKFALPMAAAMGLWLALAPVWAQAPRQDADSALSAAYMAYVNAEMAAASNRGDEALAEYRRALELYVNITSEHPGWHTDMINYRISQCLNEIRRLEAKAGNGAARKPSSRIPPAGTVEVDEPAAGDTATGPHAGVEQLNAEISKLEGERDRLAAPGPTSEAPEPKTNTDKPARKNWLPFWGQGASSGNAPMPHRQVAAAVRVEAQRLADGGDTQKGIDLLLEAADLMPAETDIRMMLGTFQCRIGRFADAQQVMSAVVRDNPTNAPARLLLGTAWMGAGNLKLAQKEMTRALQLDPRLQEAHYNLAQMLLESDPFAGREHYRRMLELGGQADANLESELRRACLMQKAAEISKK